MHDGNDASSVGQDLLKHVRERCVCGASIAIFLFKTRSE
jgi:hypothetical protein